MSFFEELKRRNVIRVGIAYLVIAWLIAQVADLALNNFHAPEWVIQSVLVLLALGLPLSLFFAWAFELTPEGIKREKDVDPSASTTPHTGRKLDFVIIGLLIMALAYFVSTHNWSKDSNTGLADTGVDSTGPKSIAVLPFTNLSDSNENAFFASGIQEDILTYLAKVADLKVISRTSVRPYTSDTERNLKTIATDLGVDHIVEGSVRRANNTVRVTAQLIDAQTDEHLWAENYDRDLTDVFAIQTAVAQEIVAALRANLTPLERAAISARPTDSIAAYDLYLQARAIDRDLYFGREKAAGMLPLLEGAIELDPNFALAYALLASAHCVFYWTDADASEERLVKARVAIDRAFELQPNLAEARAALAEYYYRGFKDYDRALIELKRAHALYPNNTEVLAMTAYTQRRLGHWDDAVNSFNGVIQLDPGNLSIKKDILDTLIISHRWSDAIAYANDGVSRYPDEDFFKIMLAFAAITTRGDVEQAQRHLSALNGSEGPRGVLAIMDAHVFAGEFDQARSEIDRNSDSLNSLQPGYAAAMAATVLARYDRDAAVIYAQEAIEDLEPFVLGGSKKRVQAKLTLGFNYAVVGRADEARKIANDIIDSRIGSPDAIETPYDLQEAAQILMLLGETDAVLEILEEITDKPAGPTGWQLALDPIWTPLHDNQRFAALTANRDRFESGPQDELR